MQGTSENVIKAVSTIGLEAKHRLALCKGCVYTAKLRCQSRACAILAVGRRMNHILLPS